MTALSAQSIAARGLVSPFHPRTVNKNGLSWGLGPAGYDIRLDLANQTVPLSPGQFMLAAAVEYFSMDSDLIGVVHDKSTWARRGLACQNTIIEPGWRGHLTLELTNHGVEVLWLRHGDPIAQVVFHLLDAPTQMPYAGKYQDQPPGPQPAR